MWLTGRLVPDHKTIATSARTMAAPSGRSAPDSWLCRTMGLLMQNNVAIDGSKFKAVNNRTELHARQDGPAHGAD